MQNWIICILIVLCLVLNGTTTSSVILLIFLLYLFIKNVSNIKKIRDIKFLLISSFAISLCIGLLNGILLNQIIRYIALVILFWTYPLKFELERKHLYLLVLTGLYLIVMQVGNALGIPDRKS